MSSQTVTPTAKPVTPTATKAATKPAAKKQTAKPATKVQKSAVKSARKLMTHEQRSEAARLAAYKAHNHPTFMKIHGRAAKSAEMTPKAYIREMKQARPAKYRSI